MLFLNTNRLEHFARNWIVFGFFVYLGAVFFLGKSKVMFIFTIFITFPALILFMVTRFKCIQDRRVLLICATFLGYFSLSTLWGEGNFILAVRDSLYILCFMLSVTFVSQKFSENFVVKFIIAIGLIAAISYIVGIFMSDHDLTVFMNSRFSFFDIGGRGYKNQIDSAIVIGLPIIAAWYFFPGKKYHVKLMLIVTIMLCTILMFVTKSRGPILAVATTLLCIALYRRERSDFLLLFIFAILTGVILLFSSNLTSIIINRVGDENYRFFIWHESLRLFMDHWLLGQGYGTSAEVMLSQGGSVEHAHNTIIEVFRVGGIVGGVLFVFMLGSMLRFTYVHSGNRFFLFWLLFGVLCMATTGRLPLVKPTLIDFFVFWPPLFLLYFLRRLPTPINQTDSS
jgi:O-antigen ligase